MSNFLKLKNFALDLLFPSQCLGCQKDTSDAAIEERFVCFSCFEKIPVNAGFFCPACHSRSPEGNACTGCRGKSPLKKLIIASDYDHEILKKMILAYKYDGIKDLCQPLHNLTLKHLDQLNFSFDENVALVSVPLHKTRERLRGFNQSALIAQLLSRDFKLPLLGEALIRSRNTTPQVDFYNPQERKKNMQDAFACQDPDTIRGKKLLLIDDVITTGATLRECAKTLRAAGAKEVWALAIAKG